MTTPKEKDMPVACSHVAECITAFGLSVTLSSIVEKRLLSRLSDYAMLLKFSEKTMNPRHSGQLFNQTRPIDQKVTPRHSGQLFNTATSDKVRRMRKGQLFHFT